jgi:hypothetical protein
MPSTMQHRMRRAAKFLRSKVQALRVPATGAEKVEFKINVDPVTLLRTGPALTRGQREKRNQIKKSTP